MDFIYILKYETCASFDEKWILFTFLSTRPVCLLMKSGFYLVFVISIIKWKVLVNKFLKVYLSVRTSLCSADNGSLC